SRRNPWPAPVEAGSRRRRRRGRKTWRASSGPSDDAEEEIRRGRPGHHEPHRGHHAGFFAPGDAHDRVAAGSASGPPGAESGQESADEEERRFHVQPRGEQMIKTSQRRDDADATGKESARQAPQRNAEKKQDPPRFLEAGF